MKDMIKRIAHTIAIYIFIILISTVIFILLFHAPILKWLDVFFYRGCVFLLLSAVISAALTLLAAKKLKRLQLEAKDAVVVFFLFAGFTLGWFTLLPVTVERSVSVFMLSYMDQNDETGMTADEFGDVFYEKYIEDFGAFDKRFAEQELSGNMVALEDGSGYVITENGRFIVNLFRLCANLFDTEKWLVYPNDY